MCDATSLDTSDEEMEGWSDKQGLRMDAETNKLVQCHCPDEAMTDNWYKIQSWQVHRPYGKHWAADSSFNPAGRSLLLDTSCVAVMCSVWSPYEGKLFLSTIPQSRTCLFASHVKAVQLNRYVQLWKCHNSTNLLVAL